MDKSTDVIEKKILLRAPTSRVWRALSDPKEFGGWFGVKIAGEFTPGARVIGTITPTSADAEVAEKQKPYEGKPWEIVIGEMVPERLFSFRWHPFAVDADFDYSVEPMTLVTFALQAVAEGTLLTVTESGFDGVPLARRAQAFAMNEQGWGMVVTLLEKHVARTP